ncbi:hypothetical protein [Azospirillum sp.]|uniref:hypothetical protein n=1 Tax=Azospirillum sp. TaxID=34012 RepID=UPI002D569363|nr:hypothetical protein [Azospirillum sp.]HYD64609.1 hypothetical protein [Azospirillum sp.]
MTSVEKIRKFLDIGDFVYKNRDEKIFDDLLFKQLFNLHAVQSFKDNWLSTITGAGTEPYGGSFAAAKRENELQTTPTATVAARRCVEMHVGRAAWTLIGQQRCTANLSLATATFPPDALIFLHHCPYPKVHLHRSWIRRRLWRHRRCYPVSGQNRSKKKRGLRPFLPPSVPPCG